MAHHTPDRSVELVPRGHRLRGAAEGCAAQIYAARYGARLQGFPDLMATLPSADGGIGAVAGVRFGTGEFFSESYLDGPVESCLARIAGTAPSRRTIVEYTTLAAARAGAGARLVRALVNASLDWGYDWSFFTATTSLRRLLAFQRVPFHVLAIADPSRIAGSQYWGSYYAHDPLVCAVWRRDLIVRARPDSARQDHAPLAVGILTNA